MKAYSLILLLGVYLFHWTAANQARFKNYRPVIKERMLENVTIIVNSSHIDLSSLDIGAIDYDAFDTLSGIKSLDLSNNTLALLAKSTFSKLTNLEELSLANNEIYDSDMAFVGLNKLKRLDLSNNSISRLAEELTGLQKSTEIIIEGNDIETLAIPATYNPYAEPISGIALSYQSSYENDKAKMPRNFQVKICMTDDGTVRSLEELKQNETLGNCTEVKLYRRIGVIHLGELGIKKFERSWYKLSVDFIRKITLSNNEIADIEPELLNDLPINIEVNLWHNKITTIKKNIMASEHCVALNLNGQRNALQTIEEGAFEHICLYKLEASNNSLNNLNFLRTIPVTIEILDLSQNRISEIPPNTFQGFKNLQRLDLSSNNLEIIESGIFDGLENVHQIRLHDNKIGQWNSESFRGLNSVYKITLNQNKIRKITTDIFSRLKSSIPLCLDFADNEIDSIEEGSLFNLTIAHLGLHNNKITDGSIAKGAFNMSNLGKLTLSSNLITHLNGELFSGISGAYALQLKGNPIKTITNFSWSAGTLEEW